MQEALKKEIYTKNQYYDKVNEYQDVIKDLKEQLNEKTEELNNTIETKAIVSEPVQVSKSKLDELERKNSELTCELENVRKDLSEQKRVNEIQSKQLSTYVEELRRICASNLEMKNKLEEMIKDREMLQSANDNYKISIETLHKEKQDFLQQLQKCLTKETEDKKQIQELESKVINPEGLAYIYNMKKETVLGKEDIQVNLKADDKETDQRRFCIRF